jgi:CHAT domain-containing protein
VFSVPGLRFAILDQSFKYLLESLRGLNEFSTRRLTSEDIVRYALCTSHFVSNHAKKGQAVNSAYSSRPQISALSNRSHKALRLRFSGAKTISIMVALVTAQLATPGFTLTRLQTSSGVSKTGVQSKDIRNLMHGVPVERELQPGEVHWYQVHAGVGQYFRVVLMQDGIDVSVKLTAPDGRQIVEVDSPNARSGPEPVSAIAELAGSYELEVKALDEKTAPGRYQISLLELREPTALDRDRIAAERALAEAEHLHAQATKESLHQALANYNQALPVLRVLGDRGKEAETLTVRGAVYFLLGQMHQALEYFNQALVAWRTLDDRASRIGEASTLNSMASTYDALGQSEKGLALREQALVLSREAGDRLGEAYMLRDIGNSYLSSNYQKAFEYMNRALSLAREVHHRKLEGQILTYLGNLLSAYGEPQMALEYSKQALKVQREIGDQWMEARSLDGIARVYLTVGEPQQALTYLDASISIHRATGNRLDEAFVLLSIGRAYSSLGEPRVALNYLQKALSLAQAIENRPAEASVLIAIARTYRDLGDPIKALGQLSRVQSLYRAAGSQRSEGQALAQIGTISFELGKLEDADDSLRQALRLQKLVGDKIGEAYSLSEMGAVYIAEGKLQEAVKLLDSALSLQRAEGDTVGEAITLRRLADAERSRGRLEAALANVEASVEVIEKMRHKLDQRLRTSFSASNRKYYELHLEILMEMHRRSPAAGYDAAALQVNERSRARSLLESLIESHSDIRAGVDAVLLNRERYTQQRLNAKAEWLVRLLNAKHTAEQESDARREVEDLINEYREIEAEIRTKSPRYAALTQPQQLSLKEIQQQVLDENTVLLEYALGDKASYVFAVTPTSIKSYQLPKREAIEKAARRAYELLINMADALYPDALVSLSRLLLGPVAGEISNKRLLIVSDGALQYVPFAALPDPTSRPQQVAKTSRARKRYEPLIARHEIITLPSASVLALQRQELSQRADAAKKLVVIADPVFNEADRRVSGRIENGIDRNSSKTRGTSLETLSPDIARSANDLRMMSFERLPLSRLEAEAITKRLPKDQSLTVLDFAANHNIAMSPELSKYQIVHFATHSLLNNEHPELSGIVLSLVDERGRPQNGFLRLNEVYSLNLEADLVVLSACQTALGKEIKGEGLVGLTRGFMYAGARRVVASVWKVSDKATSELMKRFYDRMLKDGMRPAAALRAAQVSMLEDKQWAAAYYWAGFVLQGDWR